jgi:hypothetical protein
VQQQVAVQAVQQQQQLSSAQADDLAKTTTPAASRWGSKLVMHLLSQTVTHMF